MLIGIKEEIVYEIEDYVKNYNMNYIDAVLLYCEKNNLDEEFVGQLLSKNTSLKLKIEMDAESLNFLQKTDRLPI